MRLSVVSVLILVLLSGCGTTAAQREFLLHQQGVIDAIDMASGCDDKLGAEFPELGVRTPLRPPLKAAGAQLIDPERPTPEEQTMLVHWRGLAAPCRDAFIAAIRASAPIMATSFETMYATTDAIYLRLAQAEIPWGTANLQLNAARQTGGEQAMHAAREWTATEQAKVDRDAARRNAIWASLGRAFEEAAADYAKHHRVTSCTRIGPNTRECITW